MTELAIEVHDLRVAYGDHVAVDGADLTVARGELVALLGTNGAGKTTMLETIEGHRRADAGSVRVLGLDPGRERLRLLGRVGVMLQESGFSGELTTWETADLWRSLRRRGGDADAVLERLELAHRRDVPVKQLSGGERRRLDLAIAILGEPEVLFLDEPTTGLDPQSRRRTWEVVGGLVENGTAVLLTTHYLEEAEALASRIAILDRGRIARRGTMAELVAGIAATIVFQLPAGAPALPPLTAQVTTGHGDDVVAETTEPQQDLRTLLDWADAHRLRLARLRVRDGSLEDVFERVAHEQEVAA
ncbi:ABC transporter ATP-binding protein [Conexibacter sp. JD483]|uniref:ABC transporter ATP-binding protein n=1 Tax=unclassified Conexibacter TaxID=2627773 RepID=UPI002726EFF4|nr:MULTISPECIES: ABC transporter ATP-binding protein [unclassified Conexibacter]MDO8187760.1 ABC transporter ATP-binding protein [Conexibacter sp. CPCC 205706]MDO8201369.1 ABC transporter ATP-binding protein [Conexibacter sp. CPCC 205762]MDR9372854.1 ABC transporter ATP-binding protein [Conexibacter sp. JD483]